jgi:membrane protease YdiL (CAAX protease family)
VAEGAKTPAAPRKAAAVGIQKKKEEPTGAMGFLKRRHDPLTSIVLVVPLFLIYHLGILAMDIRNGADLFTEATLRLLQESLWGYIGVTVVIAAGLVGAAWVMRKRTGAEIHPRALVPVIGESLIWAIVMTFVVGWATAQLTSIQQGPAPMGPLEKLVMACGAGLHEEIVFRAGLFAGGTWILTRFAKWEAWKSAIVAGVVSSLVFSAFHYIGPLSDPLHLGSFTFRALAGGFLAAIYRFRGFAVAVYTHALYDVLVFFVL